jgi:CRP-like cAMP-binding protein
MKKADPLKKIPLFNALNERERRQIAREIVETHYTKDQYIFREGDPADYFHIVKEGSVKCVKSSPDGKDVTMKVLMPGDLFCCEAAVFDGAPHPGCAQPIGDVSILRLSKKCYLDMLRRHPDAALEIIKYLGKRLNEAQDMPRFWLSTAPSSDWLRSWSTWRREPGSRRPMDFTLPSV